VSSRTAFWRKIGYLCAIVVLLSSLAWISPPETTGSGGQGGSPGGVLAQLRSENGLSQANLGEIDPTSEAIKLATLGMRGVAANVLWTKANDYFRTKDWNNFSATVQQIIKLQPNFVGVWRYQGWVQAYNVSVEWDDYRDRYFWVTKGINFLREGTRYNDAEPILQWDIGWTTGHKIGRADESKQFRQLFRDDDVFHGDRAVALRDNWLVGKEAFLEAREMMDNRGLSIRGQNPLLFHADIPLWQANYASAREDDGDFGEVARLAWEKAAREFEQFGVRDLPAYDGRTLRLADYEANVAQLAEIQKQMEEAAPGLRDKLLEEKMPSLTEEELVTYKRTIGEYGPSDYDNAQKISRKLHVTYGEISDRAKDLPTAEQVAKLCERGQQLEATLLTLDNWRNVVKYTYWNERCKAEATEDAIEGRRAIYEADRAFRDEAELEKARDLYVTGMGHWRKVLDQYPVLKTDPTVGEGLADVIMRYQDCLRQLDETLPEPFVLADVMEAQWQYMQLPK
jgi:hypothetical protein